MATDAGLNQGIISALIGFTPLPTALLFYCFYNEKLNKNHLYGIFLMLICLGLLSYRSDESKIVNGHNVTMWVLMKPFLLVFLIIIGVSLHTLLIRYAIHTRKMPLVQFNIDAFTFSSIFSLIMTICYWDRFTISEIQLCILAGILQMIGTIALTKAIHTGIAASAMAIMLSCTTLFHIILAFLILQQGITIL